MKIMDPVELLYLSLLLRWEKNAPTDGRQGLLDRAPERNTQISRFIYLMRKIAAGSEEKSFSKLAVNTRRNDGESYISKNSAWMINPRDISKGWSFEGCTNLEQKQEFLQKLTKLGLSPAFVSCADDFVAGLSVMKYIPSKEQQDKLIERWDQETLY